MPNPVFVGDTLWAESEIVETRESRSTPTRRDRLDALPRDQPAPRGRDRVQADVHDLQARRARGRRARSRARRRPGMSERPDDLRTAHRGASRRRSSTSDPGRGRRGDEAPRARRARAAGSPRMRSASPARAGATMAELGDRRCHRDRPRHVRCPRRTRRSPTRCSATALDFDDTHSDSVCHITVVVVPAALAVAESLGRSGEDVLAAVTAGTEVVARIGMAASGAFHARGFHPTSVCGVFGATAAAARLAGLDAETTTSALGLAGQHVVGPDGVPRRRHADEARARGLGRAGGRARRAARRSRSRRPGRRARRTVRRLPRVRRRRRVPPSRSSSTTSAAAGRRSASSYKPYPACHFMHGSLGATESLLDRRGGRARSRRSTVTVPEPLVPVDARARGREAPPPHDYEGKFSLQYSTAAMLVHGRVDLATYTDGGARRPGRPRARREGAVRGRGRSRRTRARFPGGVRIRTTDGRTARGRAGPPARARPQNPMSEAQVRAKFRDNASLALDAAGRDALEERDLAPRAARRRAGRCSLALAPHEVAA